MKQFKLLSYLLVAVLSFGFVSCSDDDPTFNDSEIVGTWTVTKVVVSALGESETITYRDGEWYVVLEEDGTGYEKDEDGIYDDIEWTLKNGNKLKFYYLDYDNSVEYKITELTTAGGTLEISKKEDGITYNAKISIKKYTL